MSESDKERLLGQCLEEHHRRRALGETVSIEEWRERLGEHFEEFQEILAAASEIDDLIEPSQFTETLPRTFGEYTLKSVLGRGAMGVVYEAVHRGLGRRVALKVLRSGFEEDALAYERFRREARACAQVQHDHIVTIYEAGQEEGRPFYAMRVIEGKSLLQLVHDGEVLSPRELCHGLASIADALGALHAAGIVHRDVKPANIMVDPDRRMILADFGLARSAVSQTLTATGQALGTPLYMSPEQLLGQKGEVDGVSDVYGLGVTLYEALTGRPPFEADNVTGLMRMILTERPRPPIQLVPDLPLECTFIAMKAMERRKADRYQTAETMRLDLLAFADGRRVEGRPVSHLRYSFRKYRRRVLVAITTLAVLVVSAVLFFTRDATLSVHSFPQAQVFVDGALKGPTPIDIRLDPGVHELTLCQGGFGDRTLRIELSAGEIRTLETALVASEGDDPVALRRIANELDIAFQEFESVERAIGKPGGLPVHVLYPRGDVRLVDLVRWRVDVPDEFFEVDGEIRFMRGEEVLARIPFDGEMTWTIADLPRALTQDLAIGDEIEWGYFPTSGEPITATFKVVPDPLSDRLASLRSRLEDQPQAILGHLRVQIYLNHGLFVAAYGEARRLAEEHPNSDRAWSSMLRAVQGVGLGDTLLAREVQRRYDRKGE